MDDFIWRVSMAQVDTAGPFSVFPAIDRILTVLDGTLALRLPGAATTLRPDSAPFAFPGDVACHGAPLAGPVLDLNVMTRRGRAAASVQRCTGQVTIPTGLALLVAARAATLSIGGTILTVQAHDALRLTHGAVVDVPGPAILIRLYAPGPGETLGAPA